MTAHATKSFEGPACWTVSALGGAAVGFLLSKVAPAVYDGSAPEIPLWLVTPFVALLLSIALMPFLSPKIWHHHFPDFSFFLGSLVSVYYLAALDHVHDGHSYGVHTLTHTALEYFSFIALIGGLYVASGGIVIDTRGKTGPIPNTILLAAGAVLSNLVGTTGASVLLIRPFIRANKGRITPLHVVFFIFIVSNCGGSLTPIGDPPLFLGYIKGVPFFWTVLSLWKPWVLVNAVLLAAFYVYDRRCERTLTPEQADAAAEGRAGVRIRGAGGIVALVLIVAAVLLDPFLTRNLGWTLPVPIGPFVQIIVAVLAYRFAPVANHAANGFSLFPVKEVGLLFIGIFLTMMPALAYLSHRAPGWGVSSPTAFYFLTGSLSAGLDNAPTYLSFLQIAFGDQVIDRPSILAFLGQSYGPRTLEAISLGSVYFGAMTYIGNGPNFMVRSIAEASGVRMPSFFGYLGWACVILLPVLILAWLVFVR